MMRAKDSLFDCLERDYMGYIKYSESQFCFLNRSAASSSRVSVGQSILSRTIPFALRQAQHERILNSRIVLSCPPSI